MNTLVILACVLAVAHGSAIGGWGGYGLGGYGLGNGLGGGHIVSAPIYAPAAISTANMVKAAPIPIVRTVSVPIVTAPVSYGWGGLGGWGGYGWGGLGAKSSAWVGNPWGGYGWSGLGAKSNAWVGNPWGGYGWGGWSGWGKH